MSYKRFLFLFLFFLGLCACLIFGFFFYLSRIYEHNTYSEIVQRQIKKNSLYGTALNNFPVPYFFELIKQRQPEILMVGSSRSGWFKEKYFNTSFVTTPKASDTLMQMESFLNEVMNIYTPKIVIMEFDPWLLLQKPRISSNISKGESGKSINLFKIYSVAKLVARKNMVYLNPFKDNLLKNPYIDFDSLGIFALTMGNGFLKDGSYFHGSTYFGKKNILDRNFQLSIWQIDNGQGPFRWAKAYDGENIVVFKRIVKELKKKKIIVIPIIMPISPLVYQKSYGLYPDKYAYWKKLSDNAKKLGIYDFLNPFSINTNDCEFLDGVHPGDVASARVLKKIGEENPAFAKYLNMKEINWAINNRAGHVYSGQDFGPYKEVDFLGLGCKKH